MVCRVCAPNDANLCFLRDTGASESKIVNTFHIASVAGGQSWTFEVGDYVRRKYHHTSISQFSVKTFDAYVDYLNICLRRGEFKFAQPSFPLVSMHA